MEIMVKLDNSIFKGVIRMKGLECLQENGKRGIRDSEYNTDIPSRNATIFLVLYVILVFISSEEFIGCKERVICRYGTWRS